MNVIVVCRMGSSRLPGKTLAPFGSQSLLAHVIRRIEAGGVSRQDICIATSDSPVDAPIVQAASKLNCAAYTGDAADVSRRVLGASDGLEGFILVLGDNPWIDPAQLFQVIEVSSAAPLDYAVTATQELPESKWPDRLYPIGTRLHYIRRNLMWQQLRALDSPDVQEHTSKLFSNLAGQDTAPILTPEDGFTAEELNGLNISINTEADYHMALAVLEKTGPEASASVITQTYLNMKEKL